jgi:hypothetical protein
MLRVPCRFVEGVEIQGIEIQGVEIQGIKIKGILEGQRVGIIQVHRIPLPHHRLRAVRSPVLRGPCRLVQGIKIQGIKIVEGIFEGILEGQRFGIIKDHRVALPHRRVRAMRLLFVQGQQVRKQKQQVRKQRQQVRK